MPGSPGPAVPADDRRHLVERRSHLLVGPHLGARLAVVASDADLQACRAVPIRHRPGHLQPEHLAHQVAPVDHRVDAVHPQESGELAQRGAPLHQLGERRPGNQGCGGDGPQPTSVDGQDVDRKPDHRRPPGHDARAATRPGVDVSVVDQHVQLPHARPHGPGQRRTQRRRRRRGQDPTPLGGRGAVRRARGVGGRRTVDRWRLGLAPFRGDQGGQLGLPKALATARRLFGIGGGPALIADAAQLFLPRRP